MAYRIRVRLDPAAKQIVGHERLTWRNPSPEAVSELWLHLYLNAFKNSRSTFYRESGGRRREAVREEGWGSIDLTAMRLVDGPDLLPAMTFEHPDDDNGDDRTVARVALPAPVPPAGSVSLDIDFRAQLPKVRERTGYVRDFFLVGQWFPKAAVYEPAGVRERSRGGWNAHQFHANSEFYADYGQYHVEITAPARFVIGATGRRVDRTNNPDGTTTHTYEQADVHDFAWTADPGYVEVKRTFSAQADVSPADYEEAARLLGRSPDEVRLSDVELTFLMQPCHRPQLERYVAATKLALKAYGLGYGRYPYPTLTVVDPAAGGSGAGGMEYPTLVTALTSFLFQHWPLDGVNFPELVLVHEVGHQWFYGLIGSNEFEESWLDEGFNSYAETRTSERAFGADATYGRLLGVPLGGLEYARLFNSPDRVFDAIRSPAWGYSPGAYAFNSYSRSTLTLRTLEGLLGDETMARVMRTYAERFRFRHPSSDDFYAVAQEVSGRDLRWFFDQTVERPGIVDYEVASVESVQAPEPPGVAVKDRKARPWESTVVVRRRGEVMLPVDVELRFEGGARDRRAWDARDRWVRYRVTRPERLLSAHLDPDRKIPLDVAAINDAKRVDPDGRASARWSSSFLFWVQQILAFVGM